MMNFTEMDFQSKYFTLYKVAEGIYAAIEKEEGQTGSNAGIIDLGDKVVVFDTLLSLDGAKDLRRAAIEVTGREPDYVVISHFHVDHNIGSQVFSKDTDVIASKAARNLIDSDTRKSVISIQEIDEGEIKKLEEQLKIETDKDKILDIKNDLKYIGNIKRPDIELRTPNMDFDNNMTVHGEKRNLQLISFEAAHSDGDVIGYLSKDKVCFTGDILFKDSHPWLGSGDPKGFISVLRELVQMDIEIFVPGHGPVGTKDDIKLEIKYIEEMIALVEGKISRGEDIDSITLNDISPLFRDWDGTCFQWNIAFLERWIKESKVAE